MNKIITLLSIAMFMPALAVAEEVVITHADGTFSRVELLKTSDGAYYYVAGNQRHYLQVDDICEGKACSGSADTATVVSNDTSANDTKPYQKSVFGVFGSNTVGAELMPRLIEGYAEALDADMNIATGVNPLESTFIAKNNQDQIMFEVSLHAHGSGSAFPGLQTGEAEIGMASRAIKDKEVAALEQAGISGMRSAGQEHVLALDGLVVIVAPDNPIATLSMEQIAKIFSGDYKNWSDVGGPNMAITLYSRDSNSGTFDTFKSLVLKPNKRKLSESAQLFESNEELSDAVALDPAGIGFTGFAYVRNAKTLALSADCGIVSEPSVFSVKTEEYPLARRLYLYTSGKAVSEHATGLLAYSMSDVAQETIADIGFIDQSPVSLSFGEQAQRFSGEPAEKDASALRQEMLNTIGEAERLSTTFRFKLGSSELDVKSIQDVSRIAKMISAENSPYKGKEIYLVGFTDSIGKFANNLRLSKTRSQQVLMALSKSLPESMKGQVKSIGYGELSPVACNTDDAGQAKNRRVEIWVR